MSCKREEIFSKISNKKIDKNMEVTIEVMEDLEDCYKIDTRYRLGGVGGYKRLDRPENMLECMNSCATSGTLYIPKPSEEVAYADFFLGEDATAFANGVFTMYAKGQAQDIEIMFSSDATFTDADVYKVALTGEETHQFVAVELTKTPTSVNGNGWKPAESGVFIRVAVNIDNTGVSTIAFYSTLDAFNTSEVIKIGCMTNVGGDYSFDLADATCFGQDYTTDLTEQTRTYTGNAVTPNYTALNPLEEKGTSTTGFETVNEKQTIVADATGNYGKVTLHNVNHDVCGLIGAQLVQDCVTSEAQLTKLTIPALVDIEDYQYVVIKNTDGTTDLYFNKALVGETIVVTYPKTRNADEYIVNSKPMSKRVRVTETVVQTNGQKVQRIYNNGRVTSFPDTITEEDTEFSFEIRYLEDETGVVGRRYVLHD